MATYILYLVFFLLYSTIVNQRLQFAYMAYSLSISLAKLINFLLKRAALSTFLCHNIKKAERLSYSTMFFVRNTYVTFQNALHF